MALACLTLFGTRISNNITKFEIISVLFVRSPCRLLVSYGNNELVKRVFLVRTGNCLVLCVPVNLLPVIWLLASHIFKFYFAGLIWWVVLRVSARYSQGPSFPGHRIPHGYHTPIRHKPHSTPISSRTPTDTHAPPRPISPPAKHSPHPRLTPAFSYTPAVTTHRPQPNLTPPSAIPVPYPTPLDSHLSHNM